MLLLLLACASPAPVGTAPPMDGGRDHTERSGAWTAEVVRGQLTVRGPDGPRVLGAGVLAELAWHGDALVYPQGDGVERDLFLVHLPDGAPVRLTDWEGYEDRPAWSPDGARVAFFSGRTGLPSLYTLEVETGTITQLTNVGVAARAPRPGVAPEGFVPPPSTGSPTWTETGLSWTSSGGPITVAAP